MMAEHPKQVPPPGNDQMCKHCEPLQKSAAIDESFMMQSGSFLMLQESDGFEGVLDQTLAQTGQSPAGSPSAFPGFIDCKPGVQHASSEAVPLEDALSRH